MNKNVKISSATGKEGRLIKLNDKYYFRMYFDDFKVKDYEINHNDLVIRIQDHCANLCEHDSVYTLENTKSTRSKKI